MRRAGAGSGACVSTAVGSLNLAPPPIASTDTASTTSSLLASMNPNRALCAASNADCRASSDNSGGVVLELGTFDEGTLLPPDAVCSLPRNEPRLAGVRSILVLSEAGTPAAGWGRDGEGGGWRESS